MKVHQTRQVSVGQPHLAKRLLFPANMDLGQVVMGNFAEAVYLNEEIRVGRVLAMCNEIEKLRRLVRNVTDHQVDAQVEAGRDALDIHPVAIARVHLHVRERRESTIGIGRIQRQDMYTAQRIAQVPIQKLVEFPRLRPRRSG
ncbi:hypothetical protein OMD46_19795 [Pseudomonas sp. MDMC_285]|nr:hypothetical protein [Pseudomonas sp. MDMC_285]